MNPPAPHLLLEPPGVSTNPGLPAPASAPYAPPPPLSAPASPPCHLRFLVGVWRRASPRPTTAPRFFQTRLDDDEDEALRAAEEDVTCRVARTRDEGEKVVAAVGGMSRERSSASSSERRDSRERRDEGSRRRAFERCGVLGCGGGGGGAATTVLADEGVPCLLAECGCCGGSGWFFVGDGVGSWFRRGVGFLGGDVEVGCGGAGSRGGEDVMGLALGGLPRFLLGVSCVIGAGEAVEAVSSVEFGIMAGGSSTLLSCS